MWVLRRVNFGDLQGWENDDHFAALSAFSRQSLKPPSETYRQGKMGVSPQCLTRVLERADTSAARASPRAFFESNFVPCALFNTEGKFGQITGFYEPEVEAQFIRGGSFQTPIFRRPDDLVALNSDNRPNNVDETYRFGRKLGDGTIQPYFDRSEINAGAIDKSTSPIAFVQDPIEAFFIHIQGAARLRFYDGTTMRITYDGKSGHPFTPIGKLLVQRGEIDAQDISMQTIKSWLAANPDKASGLMEENRSYIFFKRSDDVQSSLGPIAAAKVPLSAGRSLAVDRLVHTFGTPIFVNADNVNGQSLARLMVAQETGTAIVGPARGDIFFGSGAQAGELAGAVNTKCTFTLLIPKTSAFEPEKVQLP